jgi:hypothetical protein
MSPAAAILCLWLQTPAAPPRHWAYVPPKRPARPAVRHADWPRNEIDYFVLKRLEDACLGPSPEAPRDKLLRRLSLDLTGLPPTPEELDAFLADERPDAYERVVDRLLASPHYGERWAVPWLDLARYGDTDGFNFDQPRLIWKYRDWVVDALNRDLPFDRFTIEQIAGDMLPEATREQIIATGFHRNTRTNTEGGVDPDEARWERLLDRVETTATVWLGTTLGCARCHSHKYDPFTQREFYAFLAFFEHAEEVTTEIVGSNSKVTTLTLRERASDAAPTTRLRIRGGFENVGDAVSAGVPAALAPLSPEARPDRLALARWLVCRDNPLTARVTMNRLWEQYFGRGIVGTSEDFGTQGERPTHPELLDALAVAFMERGWSLKAMHRLIVTSAVYRQDSRLPAALRERDPENKLLARGPRRRMEAEMIRDTALAAAGLLAPKLGGPPVFPLQADESGFVPVNKVDMKWVPSAGDDRYRRGLYTFVRRTAPHTSAAAFDAPSREFCTVRRPRTNTPLQALTALNDPAFFDAARGLARRILREAPADTRARATHGFRLCTSRRPDEGELAALGAYVEAEEARYESDREAARKIAGTDAPDLAAWTLAANVLLNLDETITKE